VTGRRFAFAFGSLLIGLPGIRPAFLAGPDLAKQVDPKLFSGANDGGADWAFSAEGRTLAGGRGVRGEAGSFFTFGSVGRGACGKRTTAGRDLGNRIFSIRNRLDRSGAIARSAFRFECDLRGLGRSGTMRNSISYGNGMYKSADGGKTWTYTGLSDSAADRGESWWDPR